MQPATCLLHSSCCGAYRLRISLSYSCHLLCFPGSKNSKQFPQWVEKTIDHPFLEWNDGVVGDGNAFRANLGTTLCDIAQSDAKLRSQISHSIAHVQRMH